MKFSDILGNSSAVNQVRNLIDNGRLPHALLLHGEAGVPKLALARAMAQYIHCTSPHDGEPCGKCPSCLQHQSMNHIDTFYSFPYVKTKDKDSVCDDYLLQWKAFLDDCPLAEDYQHWLHLLKNDNAQPQIYVKESDSIMHKMSLSAFSSTCKILIMWLPEKMHEDCANKLLKLIEEPNDDSKFILVSDNPKDILPTIYSRTQRIEMKRLSTDTIAHYLAQRHSMDLQDAMAVAAPADGNLVLAERSLMRDNENQEFLERFMELMRMAYSRNLYKLKLWSEAIAEMKREKSRRFLAYAARQVRENFVYNLRCRQLNYLTRNEEQFSTRFSPFINEQNVERLLAEFTRASDDIQGNGNAKIVLFDMAVNVTILIKK